MHEQIPHNVPRDERTNEPPTAEPTPHLSEGFSAPPAELGALRSPQAHPTLDTTLNTTEALAQSARNRRDLSLNIQVASTNQTVIGAFLLALTSINASAAFSEPMAHPWLLTLSAFSGAVSVLSFIRGHRMRRAGNEASHASACADEAATSPGLDEAEAARSDPSASTASLGFAGRLYANLLNDSHGARVSARALIGLTDCLHRLGPTVDSAKVLRAVEPAALEKYRGLPVERELLKVVLRIAPDTYRLAADDGARYELSRSIGRIALAGAARDRNLGVKTAIELHALSRSLPERDYLPRLELLETAYDLTKRQDAIRENIELQAREVVGLCRADNTADREIQAAAKSFARRLRLNGERSWLNL